MQYLYCNKKDKLTQILEYWRRYIQRICLSILLFFLLFIATRIFLMALLIKKHFLKNKPSQNKPPLKTSEPTWKG